MKLNLTGISGDGAHWRRAAGGLTVFINSGPGAAQVGDTVQFLAKVERNAPPTNPGQRDTALAFARGGSYGTASVPSAAGIRITGSAPWFSPDAAVGRLRSWMDRRLQRVLGDEEGAHLVRALLFGERNALTPRQADLLRGVGHAALPGHQRAARRHLLPVPVLRAGLRRGCRCGCGRR